MRNTFTLAVLLAACGGSSNPTAKTAGTSVGSSPPAAPVSGSLAVDGGATPSSSNDNAAPGAAPSSATLNTTHTRCGWIDDPIAEASFVANAAQLNAVHPKWFTLDESGNPRAAGHQDLPAIVAAARANHVRLLPLIDTDDAARLRLIINDPARRTQHVAQLVQIVHDHGYDGLEIDYEHLWDAADRAPFSAFIQELSAAFRARGYELSMAIAPIGTDNGANGYDYQVLAEAADTLHFMDYDFHYPAGHMGPIAPLGWVDAAFARAEATGHGDRFMLGLANYAIGSGWYATTRDAIALCLAAPVSVTDHMSNCSYNDFHYSAGQAPHCTTQDHGEIWFEDLGSMEEKIQNAVSHHARGVAYWTLGGEMDGFFALLHKYY
jgi:spore germination protein YaaH